MGRFDRYLLAQLLLVFGFFALILVGVYWINRAVILIDRFMGGGQSAGLVFELTLLALPSLIKLVLPIAAFVAVLQTCNRLYGDSELVVVQATGFSGFRLARPVLAFGVLVGLLVAILAHVLVPASVAQLNSREAALAEAASARILVPGTFQHPIRGITVYVRDIAADGTIADLMLTDRRDPNRDSTYTARRALLVKDEDGPKLILFEGMAQTLDRQTGQLAVTRFDDFAFTIGTMMDQPETPRLDPRTVYTPALLAASPTLQEQTRRSEVWLKREAHLRFAESLLVPPLCVMGFAALMLGTFSRFGLWRQVLLAVFMVVLVKLADNAAADQAKKVPELWFVVYLPSLLATLMALLLLWLGGGRFRMLTARLRRHAA